MKANKTVLILSLALAAFSASAAGERRPDARRPVGKVMSAEAAARQAEMMRRAGGFVVRPNSAKGKIVFVDAQGALPASNLTDVVSALRKQTRLNVVGVRGEGKDAAQLKAANGADVAVVAIDDPDSPVLLVAPEERWATVNVAKLGEGLKSEEARRKFVESRFRKELLRGFALASGGGNSQFPANGMQVTGLAELDLYKEFIPGDSLAKSQAFLKRIGVVPEVRMTYRRACKEGWAPAPTNEVQKAVWDEVHAMPTEPIKIKPETKKVSE